MIPLSVFRETTLPERRTLQHCNKHKQQFPCPGQETYIHFLRKIRHWVKWDDNTMWGPKSSLHPAVRVGIWGSSNTWYFSPVQWAENLYVETLTPIVIVLGTGVCGREVGHEGEALMHGINALIKGTSKSSLALFLPRGDATRKPWSATWKRVLTRTKPPWHPDLRFLISKLWEINFCCL